MSLMTRKSEYRSVAAGTYYSVIQSISPKTIPDGKGGEADGAEWKFLIGSDGPHYGDAVEAFTSLAWSEKSKCYGWATALLGHAPDPEEPFDLERLVGCEAYVVVSVDPKKPERTRISAVQRVIRELPPPPPPRQAPVAATPAHPAASTPSEAPRSKKPKASTPVAPPPELSDDPDEIDF